MLLITFVVIHANNISGTNKNYGAQRGDGEDSRKHIPISSTIGNNNLSGTSLHDPV